MKPTIKMTALILAPVALTLALTGSYAWAKAKGGMHPGFDFAAMDADGDGALSRDEMAAFHRARLAGADADGDGFVTRDEMKAAMEDRMAERLERMVDHMIERHDQDGDGRLGADEMEPGRGMDRMFAHLDRDADGAISKDEFAKARAKHGGHQKWWEGEEKAE
ncbi:MAG: EF-hand domain-containing protein [Paracoccaceae bacterium]